MIFQTISKTGRAGGRVNTHVGDGPLDRLQVGHSNSLEEAAQRDHQEGQGRDDRELPGGMSDRGRSGKDNSATAEGWRKDTTSIKRPKKVNR